jgi:hypothetical protein
MEINFKYKIDQKVFFMQKSKVCEGRIYCFKAYVISDWRMATHNYKPTQKLNVVIKYKICIDHYSNEGTKWIPEYKIFETKEKLIEFIKD